MQSVVRSSLVGLLALASLTACGDKVNILQPTSTTAPSVVHGVTVTPNSVPNLQIGASVTLSAAVDADAAVTDRTVTWSSSDATVASVDATGKVTGVKAGTVTVSAAAKADPSVKGAALVTVGAVATPTVTISSINQTVCGVVVVGQPPFCNSVPANLSNVAGQIDVTLNAEVQGATLRSITALIRCGADTMSQTATFAANVAELDASEAAAPTTLSFNTAQFSPAGVVALHNGQCTISASSVTTTGTQSLTTTQQFTLNNIDGVIVSTATSGASANDLNGLPWKSGNVTVSATPVLYSGRTPATVSITLPGAANTPTQTVTAATTGATSATWSGTATSGARVTQQTLIGGYDANGFPTGIHPTVLVIDTNGNDLALGQLNATSQSDLRIDNQSPAAPQVLNIPTPVSASNATGMNGWVNASYVFTGAVGRYISGGDWGVANGSGKGPANTAVLGQVTGCSTPLVGGVCTGTVLPDSKDGRLPDAGVSTTTGLVAGATTFTYWASKVVNYANLGAAGAPGTATGTANCPTTGLTQITTAGALDATLQNTDYKVRVFETDKLGNVRCTDIGGAVPVAVAAPAIQALTFGVDKGAPTAVFFDPSIGGTSAPDKAAVNIAAPAITSFALQVADSSTLGGVSVGFSGFTATPVLTTVTRLYPGLTTAQSCVVGSLDNNNVCVTATTGTTVPVNGTGAAANNAATVPPNNEGYYTYTGTLRDQAQNAGPTLTRQAVVDITRPIMGGISLPPTITGGTSASFSASASDNLDLVSSSYTLAYNTNIANPPAGSLALQFRTDGPSLGVAFDNVLTTSAPSFSVPVPLFLRNVQVTDGTDTPVAFSNPGNLPTSISIRVIDAAGNASLDQTQTISPANVPQTTPAAISFSTLAGFQKWLVSNAATPLCNAAPGTACVAPANATSTILKATAVGTLSTFQIPFSQVQFYYFDSTPGGTNEWRLIGTSSASSVTDDAGLALRTFTWTISFDPPTAFGTGGAAVPILAVGMNAAGDAIASRANSNITVTP